jgi:hypothetical protein
MEEIQKKNQDWLAERVGFELTGPFPCKIIDFWAETRYFFLSFDCRRKSRAINAGQRTDFRDRKKLVRRG